MKKLLLIRHAKAVHDLSYDDFERPLRKSGIKDAEFMAERLLAEKIIPQKLFTSPALRTLSTADIFTQFLSLSKPKEDIRIYEASRLTLVNLINGFDDKFDFVGLVGHNPAMEQVIHYLTGQLVDFPTCAIALIEFEMDSWEMISAGMGTVKWYSIPKED
ncbi:SixA phosphatase family protein [Mucilaginibacter ginsenosidivorans]|uniref:Histidine phosphatase family protein n=1 Tax=Mucilaginibacter ginsenosidivorans TaxID=398053 RepID=A0A5B8V0Y5_9SPHI|nr:histidine phosphatase family protein [Mucilaginibacter ginsenosidivorans]QEC64848.1 histidine phosphatase family protein [Mucilaginibacter ginsenosidivorans]